MARTPAAPPALIEAALPPLPVLDFGSGALLQPGQSLPPLPSSQGSASSQASTSRTRQAPPAPPPAAPSAPSLDLKHVARTVLKAKRVAVVCGAGISTATGIPDFRSGAGLFESLKKQYPDARLSSGKDLFDVGLFQSEQNASIFYNMIAELKKQADAVEPTAFHSWLKQLDDDGKLFRVYTQNIDALEEKAGLTYGLGDKSLPLPPRRAPRSPSKPSGSTTPASTALVPTSSQISTTSTASTSYPTPRSSASPPPTHSTIPRVIPLHGHLSTLSCAACKLVTPTASYLDLLSAGSAPLCPGCLQKEALRSAAGERARGVGVLRPDVVLYGEEHKDGDRVGEITQRDLMGARPDLLIVVGTTLKVKGTKRLVRELAKVIKPVSRAAAAGGGGDDDASPPPPRRRQKPIHTIYLNAEFPAPAKEWAEVFDVWMRGDIQEFVAALALERAVLAREGAEREGRKRRREEAARAKAAAAVAGAGGPASPEKGKGRAPPTDRSRAGEKENARGAAASAVEKGKARATPPSPAPALPPAKRSRTTPTASAPPSRPPSARAQQQQQQHFTLEVPVRPASASRLVTAPAPPALLLPPLPALVKPAPVRITRASSSSSLSSLSSDSDNERVRPRAPPRRASSTASSSASSSGGAGTRRSSRAATASATSASLEAAAAKAAAVKAGGGQTRLGFRVTKKGVGAVTGTKRR
ncbi:hypothetical protein JCM10450v2_006811 [Rhodotorula kratochvilovae]